MLYSFIHRGSAPDPTKPNMEVTMSAKVWWTVNDFLCESLILGPFAVRQAVGLAQILSRCHFRDKIINITLEGGEIISYYNGEIAVQLAGG
jgi:hypothetical protein